MRSLLPTYLSVPLAGAACLTFVSCVATTTTYPDLVDYEPGYSVSVLPSDYRTEVVAGETYYYSNGYYYQDDDDGYVVVDAPETSIYAEDFARVSRLPTGPAVPGSSTFMDSLPANYISFKHGGVMYYRVGDRYYRSYNDGYVVVDPPT